VRLRRKLHGLKAPHKVAPDCAARQSPWDDFAGTPLGT
jgi:hypothetical protein